jgi:hypothetical protein
MTENCGTCNYFRWRQTGAVSVGECRVLPPVVMNGPGGFWPQVELFDWCKQYAASILANGVLADGSAVVTQPNWQRLRFQSATGTGVSVDANGNLVISASGQGAIQWTMNVTLKAGQVVYYGYSWDGHTIVQLPTTTTATGTAQPVALLSVSAPLGNVLSLAVSTNELRLPLVWTGGAIVLMQTEV